MEETLCGSDSHSNAECCKYCEPMFNMCKGNQGSHQAALTAEEQAKVAEENKEMRQRYEAYVKSVAPNEAIKKQMMDVFDQMKTVNEKKLLMMALPH